ncbi:hypothetical protein AB6D75_20955 [Vibrio splendidus]
MRHRLRKQKGHMILFVVLFAGCLYGIASLGIDGARAVQNKARLADAVEVATLAIAANSDNDLTVNKKLANQYIDAYIQDKTNNTVIQINRNECRSGNQMNCDSGTRYSEVNLNVETQHNSWFSGTNDISGFKRTYEIKELGTARKYQGDAIDIVFAIDMSTSMEKPWLNSKNNRSKHIELKGIFNSVVDQIGQFNNDRVYTGDVNRVAIVPYAEFVFNKNSWNNAKSCKKGGKRLNVPVENQWKGSIQSTINDMWNTKSTSIKCVSPYAKYFTMGLTDNVKAIKSTFARFRPNGGTHSYQGLIKSAQILRNVSDPNPRQLIIVLSDGDESKPDRFESLTQKKMCSDILAKLNSRTTRSGKPITASMSFIAFDYKNSDKGIQSCYGDKNIYDATSPDALLKIIYNLISEEVGHLK